MISPFFYTDLQAMDIAGLSKLTAQTLVTVVTVLGFMVSSYSQLTIHLMLKT